MSSLSISLAVFKLFFFLAGVGKGNPTMETDSRPFSEE